MNSVSLFTLSFSLVLALALVGTPQEIDWKLDFLAELQVFSA